MTGRKLLDNRLKFACFCLLSDYGQPILVITDILHSINSTFCMILNLVLQHSRLLRNILFKKKEKESTNECIKNIPTCNPSQIDRTNRYTNNDTTLNHYF